MRLKTVPIGKIVPYPNNPRKNDNAVQAVADSIKECSYVQPIIVDEKMVILAGHTRLKALELLGVKEVPVIIFPGLSDQAKKKYRYLDNKTGEAATWDIPKLKIELEAVGIDEEVFFGVHEIKEDDYEPEFSGAIEYDAEEFTDEQFKYECPACGYKFN